jgi:Protein of unknown function (DUF2934)
MPAPARAKELAIEELSLEERIRHRAYELYVERGNQSGSEFDDWLQAEEEIRSAEEQTDAELPSGGKFTVGSSWNESSQRSRSMRDLASS